MTAISYVRWRRPLAEAAAAHQDADVEALIGAGRHEPSDGRLTYRNGYRDRTLETRLGALKLRIPKLRHGAGGCGSLRALGSLNASLTPVRYLPCACLSPCGYPRGVLRAYLERGSGVVRRGGATIAVPEGTPVVCLPI